MWHIYRSYQCLLTTFVFQRPRVFLTLKFTSPKKTSTFNLLSIANYSHYNMIHYMKINTCTDIGKTKTIGNTNMTLASSCINCLYRITGYKECSQRQRLSNIGLGLGTILEVLANVPNKPLIVYVRGARLAISRLIASKVLVEHENN